MALVKMQRKISHTVSSPCVNFEVEIVKKNAGVKQKQRWGRHIRAIESKWMLRRRKIIAQHLIRSEICEFLVYFTFLVFRGWIWGVKVAKNFGQAVVEDYEVHKVVMHPGRPSDYFRRETEEEPC